MAYTLEETVNICRAISGYIENHPDLLREEGVFRESGATNHVNQIIDATKKGAPLPLNKNYSIHDCISALKKVTQNSKLIEYYPESLPNLIQISPVATQEEKRKSAELLDTFIKTLITHSNPKAAEIIHNCLHLAFLTTSHKKENKMDASSVATELGATLGQHLLPKEDMLKQTSSAVSILKNGLEMAGTLNTYNRPYSKSYEQERTPMLQEILSVNETQQNQLKTQLARTNLALSSQKADLSKVSLFSKWAIMKDIKGNENILKILEKLIKEKENEITYLKKEVKELTPSTSPVGRKPGFLMRGIQSLATKSLLVDQTPSSSPPRRPPRRG